MHTRSQKTSFSVKSTFSFKVFPVWRSQVRETVGNLQGYFFLKQFETEYYQMLAAWDQLQDADLEDVADVIFAQVHLTIFMFIPTIFICIVFHISYFQFKKPRFPDEIEAGLLYAEHMLEVGCHSLGFLTIV